MRQVSFHCRLILNKIFLVIQSIVLFNRLNKNLLQGIIMSNNFYVGSLSFEYVNIYSIGINFGNFFNYWEYQNNSFLLEKNPENPEFLSKDRKLLKIIIDIQNVFRNFNKLSVLPDKLWIEKNNKNNHPNINEYLFQVGGGGIILRKPCANILQQFNLGQTTLTPLQIYEYETGKLWSNEVFYFLNLCEQRQYVNYPQSNRIFVYIPGAKRYSCYGKMQSNILEVNQSIFNCDVDLWHDPMLASSIFMSDRLYTALKNADMIYQWNMIPCKII